MEYILIQTSTPPGDLTVHVEQLFDEKRIPRKFHDQIAAYVVTSVFDDDERDEFYSRLDTFAVAERDVTETVIHGEHGATSNCKWCRIELTEVILLDRKRFQPVPILRSYDEE